MLSSKHGMAIACLSDSSYDYLQKTETVIYYHRSGRAHEATPFSTNLETVNDCWGEEETFFSEV